MNIILEEFIKHHVPHLVEGESLCVNYMCSQNCTIRSFCDNVDEDNANLTLTKEDIEEAKERFPEQCI